MKINNGESRGLAWWKIALGGGVVVAAVAVLLSMQSKPEKIKSTDGGVYYEGVRWNRNTGKWVDGAGKVVPKPEGMANPATPEPSSRMVQP